MGNQKGGRGGNYKQHFNHLYIVRGDATPGAEENGGNGEKNYDVLGLIAEEWLRLNPNATSIGQGDLAPKMNLAGLSKAKKRKIIENWIDIENKLVDVKGVLCDDKTKTFRAPLIWVGMHLDLPMVAGTGTNLVEEGAAADGATVRVVNPPQASPCGKAKACVTKPKDTDADGVNNETPPPVNTPAPAAIVQPAGIDPRYYALRAQAATNAKYWQPESIDWAMELKASTGLNAEFTKKYYSEQIAPRLVERGEALTGDTDDFMLSGKNRRRRNRDSREDNSEATRDDANGGRSVFGRMISGDRGHIRVNGFLDKFADGVNDTVKDENGNLVVVPKGSMMRHDQNEITTFGGKDRAKTFRILGANVHVPFLPGYSVTASNPSEQTTWSTVTGPGGLTEVARAFSDLNKIGNIGVFTNEQTVNSNTVVDARHVVAGTFLDLTTVTASENFDIVASTTADANTKQAAAIEVLKALRDQKENFLVKQNEPYVKQLSVTEDAVRDYFTKQGINVPSKEQLNDLGTYARLPLTLMPQTQLKKQHNYHFNKDKFAYFKGHEGEVHPLNAQAQDMVYGLLQNKYELRVAQAQDKVKTQTEMMGVNKEAWEKILASDASIKEYGKFVAENQQAAIAAGAWLNDIHRNPQNYFQFQTVNHTVDGEAKTSLTKMSRREANNAADDMVKALLGDNKAAIRDVTIAGHSSPMLFFRDQKYALARPEQFGPALGEAIQKNPEAFRQMMLRSIAIDEGKTDGNRHAIGMLASYARVNGEGVDNAPVKAAEVLKATMSAENAQVVDDAIFHTLHYGDTQARNAPTQGQERVQNIFAKAQNEHLAYLQNVANGVKDAKDVDLTGLYKDLFLSDAAKDAGSQQIGTLGTFGVEKAVGKDAIFLTLMRDPKAFDAIKSHLGKENDDLKDHASSNYRAINLRDRNNQLRRVIGRVQDLAEQYNASEPKDQAIWQKAVDEYNSFFVTMEVKGDRKHNRHAQRVSKNMANAVDGLYYAVGQNPEVSSTVMKTILDDARLSNAVLSATPAGASYTDAVDHTHLMLNGGGYIGMKGDAYGLDGRQSLYTAIPVKTKADGTTKAKRSGEKAAVSFDPAVSFDAELAKLNGLLADGNADAKALEASVRNAGILLGSREAVARLGKDVRADLGRTLGEAADQLSIGGSLNDDTRAALVANVGKAVAAPLQNVGQQVAGTATPLYAQLGTLKALLGNVSGVTAEQFDAAISAVKQSLLEKGNSGAAYLSDKDFAKLNRAVNHGLDDIKSGDHVLSEETQAELVKAISRADSQMKAVVPPAHPFAGLVDANTLQQIGAAVGVTQTGKVLHTDAPIILSPESKAKVDAAKDPSAQQQAKVDAVAAWVQQQVASGKQLPTNPLTGQPFTPQEAAQVMLDPQNPLVNIVTDGKQVSINVVSSGLQATENLGSITGQGRGLMDSRVLAAALIPFLQGTQVIHITDIYHIPGCVSCNDPTLGEHLMRIVSHGGEQIVTGELAPNVGKAINITSKSALEK